MMKLPTKIFLVLLLLAVFLCLSAYLINFNTTNNAYALFGGILFLLLLLSFFVIHKIIAPLNKTIQQLKHSNLQEQSVLFDKSKTTEFHELNRELNEFSIRNKEKYLYQRQYSENLSHELLTPLAVIRTKTELILQNPELRESDLLNLDGILQTVSRLSKVNQALILLSKINNNQFIDNEEVKLKELINESLENFEDQIRKKHISVRVDLKQGGTIKSNLNLLHILIVNIVKNAVFHNIENGSIVIHLKENALIVTNTGLKSQRNTEDFFQRFVSLKKSNDSIGLGLAIVKQICLFLDYDITYQTEENKHEVIVRFTS